MTAEDLGLGSTWIQVRLRQHNDGSWAEENVKQTLNAPEHLSVLGIMAFGYKAKERAAYAEEDLLRERVHREGF